MKIIRPTSQDAGRQGIALIYAVFGAYVAASIAALLFTSAGVTRVRSTVNRNQVRADYLAQSALGVGKTDIQNAVATWASPPTSGSVTINGISVPYTITPTGSSVTVTDASGMQTTRVGYEIVARAEVEGIVSSAHRIVNSELTPLYQFAVFYEGDLEIQPGPSMIMGGAIHSNGDMYLGGGSSMTLDTNYLRSVGSIYRRRKDNISSNGTVKIRQWVKNTFDPSEPNSFIKMNSKAQMGGVATTSGYDSAFSDGYDSNGDGDFDDGGEWMPFVPGALDIWDEPDGYATPGNTVLTGAHGVNNVAIPDIGSIQMYEPSNSGDYALDSGTGEYEYVGPGAGTHAKGYFHSNAGLSIIISEDQSTIRAFDGNGVELPSMDLNGAVSMTTVYDARQGGNVPILSVDMEELGEADAWPSNGLLYVAHYGMGTGTNARGVQLTEGEELESALTVVTEGSLYIHGDYNTDDKVGAAVIADAVNLLSNKWDGDKEPGGKLPKAEATTFNTAIVTGNTLTTQGSYNGGMENLPRFHEKWTGKSCTINGSFVCPWASQYADSPWVNGGNYYRAPQRSWFYEQDFNTLANLPPFTPMVVRGTDVVSW